MSEESALILVVDDNEMNRDMLSRRLERQGYKSMVAEDGVHALELLPQHPFDLVLLDIMMPRMNGYEVLESAKNDPALRHIPIIMISAVDDLDSVVKCVEMGADDYLFKPFNPILLKARISASLEKKRLRDQERLFSRSAPSTAAAPDGLPPAVAARMAAGEADIADSYSALTVLHAAVSGYEGLSAGEVVVLFNGLFAEFERLAEARSIYGLKSGGGVYIAAGGVLLAGQAGDVAELTGEMASAAAGRGLRLHAGLHTGQAIGGLIQMGSALVYDLWGEALTTAARLSAAAPANVVYFSSAARHSLGSAYSLESAGQVEVPEGNPLSVYTFKGQR